MTRPGTSACQAGEPAGAEALVAFLENRTGLTLPPWRHHAVRSAVDRTIAAAGTADMHELLGRLAWDRALLDALIADVTVGETWFFREPERFELVVGTLVPEVLARRGNGSVVQVWSAGCASGEEPCTLAILARERGLAEKLRIRATDISRAALERAEVGLYRDWALRGLDSTRRTAWFRPAGRRFALAQEIRSAVTYAQRSLAHDVGPEDGSEGALDLILCRNVLIYMGPRTVEHVARLLWRALAPGGWLVLGPADPLLGSLAPFEVTTTPAGLLYRRPLGGDAERAGPPGDVWPAAAPPSVLPQATVSALPPWPAAPGPASPPPGEAVRPTGVAAPAPVVPIRRWSTLPPESPGPGDAARHVHTVARSQGTDAAVEVARQAIQRFPLAADLRLALGLLLQEGGRAADAEQALREAVYLDRDLAPAHFALGNALLRSGDHTGAARAFRNAATIAGARPPDEPAPFGDGDTWAQLAAAARDLARRAAQAGSSAEAGR